MLLPALMGTLDLSFFSEPTAPGKILRLFCFRVVSLKETKRGTGRWDLFEFAKSRGEEDRTDVGLRFSVVKGDDYGKRRW